MYMCGWMGGEMPVAVMAGDIRWEVTHQGDIAWWVVSASPTPLLAEDYCACLHTHLPISLLAED